MLKDLSMAMQLLEGVVLLNDGMDVVCHSMQQALLDLAHESDIGRCDCSSNLHVLRSQLGLSQGL